MRPLAEALDAGLLSKRGLDRTIAVARTIADLAGRDGTEEADVAEALSLRRGSLQ